MLAELTTALMITHKKQKILFRKRIAALHSVKSSLKVDQTAELCAECTSE